MSTPPIPTCIIPSVKRADLSPAQVKREFQDLIDRGAPLRVAGKAKRNPKRVLQAGYTPKHRIDLFDARIYLSNARQNPELRFYVAYFIPEWSRCEQTGRPPTIYARIFYKDLSLVWRVASHMNYGPDGSLWVGKGDVERQMDEDGYERIESVESTSDLPLELQSALEDCLSALKHVPPDGRVLDLVLRCSPPARIEPYADFSRPRERAAANPRNLINAGRSIARFRRSGDPTSLVFTRGFEPDFARGVIEKNATRSRLYGGRVRRFRILSRNRRIQYLFLASPSHVWIVPPQATTTELSTYGVRTIDVVADPDLFIPGWEYHYLDEDLTPPELYTQIPTGFAGIECPHDEHKADASPWLEQLPIVKDFRRKLLRQPPR